MSFPLQSHYNVDSGVVIKLTWKLVMGRSDGFHWIISPMPSFFLMTGCLTTRDWTREMKLLVHQYTCAVQCSTVQYRTLLTTTPTCSAAGKLSITGMEIRGIKYSP